MEPRPAPLFLLGSLPLCSASRAGPRAVLENAAGAGRGRGESRHLPARCTRNPLPLHALPRSHARTAPLTGSLFQRTEHSAQRSGRTRRDPVSPRAAALGVSPPCDFYVVRFFAAAAGAAVVTKAAAAAASAVATTTTAAAAGPLRRPLPLPMPNRAVSRCAALAIHCRCLLCPAHMHVLLFICDAIHGQPIDASCRACSRALLSCKHVRSLRLPALHE